MSNKRDRKKCPVDLAHLQVLSLCHHLAVRITGRNQYLSWIYEDHIVMF